MRALPTVGNLQKHGAIALVEVFRADGNEVGGELDLAIFQVHGITQIDDALVMRIGDRERKSRRVR